MMTYSWIWQIHFFLMLEMSTAEVPDIKIGDQCVRYGEQTVITCTFSSVIIDEANKVNWLGPGGNADFIVIDGSVTDPKYEASTTSSTLSLTIKNTESSDIGQYRCDYKGNTALIDFSRSYIEDINCISASGGIGTLTINIGYNDVVGVVQEAEITADTNSGTPLKVDCLDDPVGQSNTGTCIFNKVPMGQYKYTVYSHGKCELACTNGTNLVEVDDPATTASTESPSPGPSGLELWIILLIVIGIVVLLVNVIGLYVYIHFKKTPNALSELKKWEIFLIVIGILTLTCIAICVYIFVKMNMEKGTFLAVLTCGYCSKSDTSEQRSWSSRSSLRRVAPLPEKRATPEGQNSSPRLISPHGAVSRQDVMVTTDKKYAAFEHVSSKPESFPATGRPLPQPNKDVENFGAFESTALSPKLPPLEHAVTTENPDSENVDEMQKKKKRKRRKKRSKPTEIEDETEEQ